MTAPPQLPTDRSKAWAAVIANQAVLPGLGSVTAGRRVGWAQMLLALGGFGLTVWWAVGFVAEWIRTEQLPLELNARFWAAVVGILLFITAWLWSLATSISILRASGSSGR